MGGNNGNGGGWRRFGPAVAAALVFSVRLTSLSALAASPHFWPREGDMAFYHGWALRFLAGTGLDGEAFYGLPGYPALLAAIYAVAGIDPFVAGLCQVVAEALTGALLFRLAAEMTPGRGGLAAGGLAAAGWAWFAPAQSLSIILMPASYAVLAFWGLVAWIARASRGEPSGGKLWPWGAMGLVAGLVATLVATVLVAVPLAVAGAAARFRRPLPAALAGAACLAGAALGTAPCWAYHRFVAKEPVFLSAHSGLNAFIGNHPGANGYPQAPPGMRLSQSGMLRDSITIPEKEAGRHLKRSEVSRYWSEKARAFVEGDRAGWLRLLGVKFRNFWSAFSYDDLSVMRLHREEGIAPPGIGFGAVAALALPGLALFAARPGAGRWVVAGVLAHMVSVLTVFVTERYRLAAVPGLLLLGSGGLAWLQASVAAGRWGRAALYAGAGLAGAFWVGRVPSDPGLWALGHYGTGIKQLAAGRLDAAERNLVAAFGYVDRNAEILFGLGNLAGEKGRPELAKGYYRQVLELDPGHMRARNNLAALALAEGDWARAAEGARAVAEAEPGNAKARFLLARALLGQGDRAAARDAAGEALRLEPARPEFRALAEELGAGGEEP